MPDASPAEVKPVTPPADGAAPVAEKLFDAGKPAEGAPKADPPAEQKPSVPEKYELKMPEGSPLEAGHLEKISAYAKGKGLSQEQAQALLERESEAVAGFAKAQKDNYEKTVDEWAKQTESDPEVGGENYKKNVELASRVIKRFGSETLIKALNDTGYGNHPELVRAFTRIGKAMSEDQLVIPGTQPAPKASIEDRFYGSKT